MALFRSGCLEIQAPGHDWIFMILGPVSLENGFAIWEVNPPDFLRETGTRIGSVSRVPTPPYGMVGRASGTLYTLYGLYTLYTLYTRYTLYTYNHSHTPPPTPQGEGSIYIIIIHKAENGKEKLDNFVEPKWPKCYK